MASLVPSGNASVGSYATTAASLNRHKVIEALLLRTIPVARRTLGEGNDITLAMRSLYAEMLYRKDGTTLDDLREAVTTLEEIGRTARRVLGGAHPDTARIENNLRDARAALRARETPPAGDTAAEEN